MIDESYGYIYFSVCLKLVLNKKLKREQERERGNCQILDDKLVCIS